MAAIGKDCLMSTVCILFLNFLDIPPINQEDEDMDFGDLEMLSPPKEASVCELSSFIEEYEVKDFQLEACPAFDVTQVPDVNFIQSFDLLAWWKQRTENKSRKMAELELDLDVEMLGSPPLSPVILTSSDFKQMPTSTPLPQTSSCKRLEPDQMEQQDLSQSILTSPVSLQV